MSLHEDRSGLSNAIRNLRSNGPAVLSAMTRWQKETTGLPAWLSSCRVIPDTGALLQAVLCVGPLATSAIPLLTPVFFVCLCILLIGTARRRGAQWRDLWPRTPAIAACLMLAIYVFLNATWSADPITGARKAVVYASLVLMSFAAVHSVAILDRQTLRRSGLFFAAGVLLGAIFVLVELLTQGRMSSFAMNWIPLLYPSTPKHLRITQGQVVGMDLGQLNHNVGVVMFNLWPGLLALSDLKALIRAIAIAVFLVAIGTVVMISEHSASQVGLLGSTIIVMAMWHWPRRVIRALAVLWCLSFVLVIPASVIAYQNGLHFATWLPVTARQRVIIWQYTAEQVFSHPLLGTGVESTPVLNRQQEATGIEQPQGFVFPRSLGSHAHDVYLQAWFELGAVGALLFAVAGAVVIMLITVLPASAQPFAAGTVAAFAIVGAFSWSMWQVWFMCAAALLPLYLRIAAVDLDPVKKGNQRFSTQALSTRLPTTTA